MQDGVETSQAPAAELPLPPLVVPPRRRSGKLLLGIALVAFVLGGGLAGWIVREGYLDRVLPRGDADRSAATPVASAFDSGVTPTPSGAAPVDPAQQGLGGVETRLALLEDRFSRIDQQSQAAAANASRAEGLLVALAARRMIEKGEPLGYLENQLKLRFGGAQPEAVQTVLAASRKPVTLPQLTSRLQASAAALSGERRNESTWTKVQRELSGLFVVRRGAAAASRPADRTERAQVLLKAGRVEDAIAEIERLPGAGDAQDWIAAARSYDQAQRALDVIETAAMLEPRELRDGQGLAVTQPSPLLPPADKAASASY